MDAAVGPAVIRRRPHRVVARKRSPSAGLAKSNQEETTDMGLDNPIHIAFLLILLLLVFGAKRLPEMGRSLGHGMRGFKDAISGEGSHASTEPAAGAVVQPTLVAQQPQQRPRPRPQAAASEIVAAPVNTSEQIPA
jgi:sec-independent protein translocase protein TatA